MNTRKIYWLTAFVGIMPRPLGLSYLPKELVALQSLGVSGLCSLLTEGEVSASDLGSEAGLCKTLGIHFWHFPIKDATPPSDIEQAHQLILALVKHVQSSQKLVIHCYGGIGRSGTIAIAVLLHLGYDLERAMAEATAMRGFDVPQTDAQKNWLRDYALFLQKA